MDEHEVKTLISIDRVGVFETIGLRPKIADGLARCNVDSFDGAPSRINSDSW